MDSGHTLWKVDEVDSGKWTKWTAAMDESGRSGQVILYALPKEVDTVNQSSG